MKTIRENGQKEQLDSIISIREDSRKILADRGDGFIVWGVLILLAGIFSYMLEQFEMSRLTGWLYLVIVAFGWVFMGILHKEQDKSDSANSVTRRIIDSIWISVLTAMSILGFIGGSTGAIELDQMTGVLYTVLGIAYFLQGIITGRNWVKNLAFGWWIGSIIMFIFPGFFTHILAMAMMIGFQIIPGLIFHRQWKAQLHEEDKS